MTETTTTPPAATTQTAPPAAPPAPVEWTAGLNDELKGFVQNKGFKDPSSVLDSYRNLEKLLGVPKERLLKLPEKDDDAEGWKAIYQKLGRPEKPEEYGFKTNDEEFGKWAKSTFHELGLTSKQAENLVNKWNGYVEGVSKTQTEAQQNQVQQQEVALKKEWGAAFDQNVAAAKRAAQGLGFSAEAIDSMEKSMGFAGVMKFMHQLGSKLGEDNFVSGGKQGGGFGALSPQAARDRIAALRADRTFVDKYVAGDVSARQEMEKLHRFAYPESN